MMARDVPVTKMASALTRLAKRNDTHTQKQVALALDEAASWNTYNLLEVWDSLKSKNIHWTTVYALLIGKNFANEIRYSGLLKLLMKNPSAFTSALFEAMKDDFYQTRSMLQKLVGYDSDISVPKQVAISIDEIVNMEGEKQENHAYKLIEIWGDSSHPQLVWLATFCLLIGKNI